MKGPLFAGIFFIELSWLMLLRYRRWFRATIALEVVGHRMVHGEINNASADIILTSLLETLEIFQNVKSIIELFVCLIDLHQFHKLVRVFKN